MGCIWSKQVILGENGQKLGNFEPKWRHRKKFREIGQIFFSLKVFKNYFSQVYGHKIGQVSLMGSIWSKQVILGGNVPNGLIFGVKMMSYVKILGNQAKKIFTHKFEKLLQGAYMDEFDEKPH